MSKRLAMFAKDVCPGDIVRLVYEIKVDSIGDLDTILPSESGNLFFIEGTVTKGPVRGTSGKFAISGDDKLDVIMRKSSFASLLSLVVGKFHPSETGKSKKPKK